IYERGPDIGDFALAGAVCNAAAVWRPGPDFGEGSVKRRTVSIRVAANVTGRQRMFFAAGCIDCPEALRQSGHAQKADQLPVGRPLGLEGIGGEADRSPFVRERFNEQQTLPRIPVESLAPNGMVKKLRAIRRNARPEFGAEVVRHLRLDGGSDLQ